ncbi:MAG: 50S ribosomal protein L30 [Candidatus Aenigmarchaeota archaeon]|nr:50S ribosomal protein L30 [Candidatus Aenigmarchaeota archaeon]
MFAVIRIRGRVGVRREIEDTLKMLRLDAVNTCVLVPETPDYRGMVEKVKDFVAYGIIDFDTFLAMLKKRGRLIGDKRLTEENVKKLGFNSIEEMAKAIFEGKVKMKDIAGLKPLFRLTPPSKGHRSIKEHYPKGSLGYWGTEINGLIERMI